MSDILRNEDVLPAPHETSRTLRQIAKERAYFCARYVGACIPKADVHYDDIPPRVMHPFDPEWNVMQDKAKDHCGPHAIAALLHTMGRHDLQPLDLVPKVRYKFHWGTHPVAMERLLEDEGCEPDPLQFNHLSPLQRIRGLEQELVRRPLILLMRDPELGLHYTLGLGFDHEKRVIPLYDPKFGMREKRGKNKDLPGNRIFSYRRLLERWNQGHVLGRNRNYALGFKTS